MTTKKIMYFNESSDGWWAYTLSSGKRWSAPQYLAVEVDVEKSKYGDRYYFSIIEGPYVIAGTHFSQYQKSAKVYINGSVGKKVGRKPVLVDTSPHDKKAALIVKYQKHGTFKYGPHATAVVYGSLKYAGVEKQIAMTGDIIEPNVEHPISIPDEKHTDAQAKYGKTDFYAMWFRIDAKTAGANFTGKGKPGDRYFHLGSGSAGCFTNIYATGNDKDWNAIASSLSKARVTSEGLYVGTIKFEIPHKKYSEIEKDVIAFGQADKLKTYVWNNSVRNVPDEDDS